MSDIIFIKLASAILLVVFVYTFAFWFGYEKGVRDTEDYRKEKQSPTYPAGKEDTLQKLFSEAHTLDIENVIEYKGYHAAVFYDSIDNILIGKVCWISDDLTFEACGVSQIQTAFHNTIDQYLEFCKEKGKSPCKECIHDLSR